MTGAVLRISRFDQGYALYKVRYRRKSLRMLRPLMIRDSRDWVAEALIPQLSLPMQGGKIRKCFEINGLTAPDRGYAKPQVIAASKARKPGLRLLTAKLQNRGRSRDADLDELLAQQAFFKPVSGVEQDAVPHIGLRANLDRDHIAHQTAVGIGHHRTLFRL